MKAYGWSRTVMALSASLWIGMAGTLCAASGGPSGTPLPPNLGGVTNDGPNDCVENQAVENADGTWTVTCLDGSGGGLAPIDPGGSQPGPGPITPGGGGGLTVPPPNVSGLSAANRFKLTQGLTEAKRKLANPACAALFSNFTFPYNSGTFMLNSWVNTYVDGSSCQPNAAAQCSIAANPAQTIHPRVVQLCRPFGNMTQSDAGNTLIHELLHASGLRESPPDPSTMSLNTYQITDMVRKACP